MALWRGGSGREETGGRQHNFMRPPTHSLSSMSLSTANTHTLCFPERSEWIPVCFRAVYTAFVPSSPASIKLAPPAVLQPVSLEEDLCDICSGKDSRPSKCSTGGKGQKKHLGLLLPRLDGRNVSLCFQRSTRWRRFLFSLSFYELPVRSSVCLSPHAG